MLSCRCLTSRLIVTLLLLTTASCGFHLRGNIQVPEQALPVYLFEDDGFHDLRRKLVKLFRQSNITTVESESRASSVIRIKKVSQTNRVISVDSFGRTSEYQLITVVDFSIDVNDVLSEKTLRLTRDVAFDPANILSFKREEKLLFDEMLSEQARLILLQLRALARKAQSQ